jgi:hypothetical protein
LPANYVQQNFLAFAGDFPSWVRQNYALQQQGQTRSRKEAEVLATILEYWRNEQYQDAVELLCRRLQGVVHVAEALNTWEGVEHWTGEIMHNNGNILPQADLRYVQRQARLIAAMRRGVDGAPARGRGRGGRGNGRGGTRGGRGRDNYGNAAPPAGGAQ